MNDDLGQVAFVVGLARRTRAIIRQNLVIAMGVVAALMISTVSGLIGLGIAVFFHEGSTLVVIANSLRLLTYGGVSSKPSAVSSHDPTSGDPRPSRAPSAQQA
jgi:Cd2+/Zn2+-exporting ATPase